MNYFTDNHNLDQILVELADAREEVRARSAYSDEAIQALATDTAETVDSWHEGFHRALYDVAEHLEVGGQLIANPSGEPADWAHGTRGGDAWRDGYNWGYWGALDALGKEA